MAIKKLPFLKNGISLDQKLANALPVGVVVLDPLGACLWWNPKAASVLGLDATMHRGYPFVELIHKPAFSRLLKKKRQRELEIEAPNTPAIRLSLTVVNYDEGQFVVMIEDVTQRHLVEKMREDFVANVSHELRTPLTVIRGYLEMLLDSKGQTLEHMQPVFEQMFGQSLRMGKLVEDLLLLSRLESDSLHKQDQQAVKVGLLLLQICEEARALSGDRAHQITLNADPDLQMMGHEDELRSAFSNLIFNAVNYTPAHGSIQVDWFKDDRGLHLWIKDTGIGIAAKHISRLTERFYRVDKARSRDKGGTGLGLAIVKHVLLRHSGQLKISSQVGLGTQFHCEFSLKQMAKRK